MSTIVHSQHDHLRNLFYKATDNDGIDVFFSAANGPTENDALLKAYKGAATAMYAGVASGVGKKLSYFNTGKSLLEAAVIQDWYNPEIRFLRFSIQTEAPFILGYYSELESDADIVLAALRDGHVDAKHSFWQRALSFMLESNELSSEQKTELKKFV